MTETTLEQTVEISRSVIEGLIEHARQEIPYEACGYLAAEGKRITRQYILNNLDQADDHFSMDPKEQFAAIKDMRSRGLKLAAVYHSHPATPARPSEEDIRLAYDPEISYVIISLAGRETEVKSFRIIRGEVTAENITIGEEAES